MKPSRLWMVAALAALGAGLPAGCAKDEKTVQGGALGESCRSSDDCGEDLACVGKVCSVSTFGLETTGKECVPIQCRTAADCCDETDFCEDKQAECEAGDQQACTDYDLACGCENLDCQDDQCVQTCDSDADCVVGVTGGTCVGGRCTECGSDDDCGDGNVCVENQCKIGCEDDGDCEALHECQDSKCVEVGCRSDRECVAVTGKVRATCQASKCEVTCTSDSECDSPAGFQGSVCSGGKCVPAGCATDDECRILLAGVSPDAQCRPASGN